MAFWEAQNILWLPYKTGWGRWQCSVRLRRGLLLWVLLINFLLRPFFFFCLPCRNHKSWACCGFGPIAHPFSVLGFTAWGLYRKGAAAAAPVFWTDAAAYEQEQRLDPSLPQGTVRVARKRYVVSSELWGIGRVLEGAISVNFLESILDKAQQKASQEWQGG